MARIDKVMEAHRVPAGTALTGLLGVRIVGGSALPSGTAAGEAAFGVVCLPGTIVAGDPVAVLKRGEIVEFGGSAATAYYAGTAGGIGTASTNATKVGTTIEGGRLVLEM